MTRRGWELPWLKRMGRKIVVHYRGCEIRDRNINNLLHPECNICQECDYNYYCINDKNIISRRERSLKYGDIFLVTTPDMKDFVQNAIHIPFFAPEGYEESHYWVNNSDSFNIVHITNHPGIEGTAKIEKSINNLKAKGYPINFTFLMGVPFVKAMEELKKASLSIGKMKMGYYANAQIESMLLGAPAITYVRPEFMTKQLKSSGFILTDLGNLEKTLEYYLNHPKALDNKRKIARESILKLHDNDQIAQDLIGIYNSIK